MGKTQSLDSFFYSQGLKVPLSTIALQGPEEMAASAEKISADDQKRILQETICNQDLVLEQVLRLQDFYAKGDMAGFLDETERLASPIAGLPERLSKALVADRNLLFLPKLIPLLQSGGAFVAVGASHLFGKTGLLHALEQKGFSLEPVSRAALAKKLFTRANEAAFGAADELGGWLRTRGFEGSEKSAPALSFLPTDELERKACG